MIPRLFLSAVLAAAFAFAPPLFATDFPTVKAQLPSFTVAQGSTLPSADLRNFFEVTDIHEQVVQFRTSSGIINVETLPAAAPASVTSFLGYVTSGRYANTFIHRSDKGLGVIQGGGYTLPNAEHVVTDPPVVLEYNLPNTRGTLSMARTSALNSGTSEWFINMDDNTVDLGQGNGGGYAVFGRVTGTGIMVADAIHALTIYSVGIFNQLPLTANPGSGSPALSTIVTMNAAETVPIFPATAGQNSVVSFSVANTNPGLVAATVSGSILNLALVAGASGVADVTVTATDSNGNLVRNVFRVSVPPEIAVEQPVGTDVPDGATRSFPLTDEGSSSDLIFTIKNSGIGNLALTGTPAIILDGADAAMFSVVAQPASPVPALNGSVAFTVRFTPTSGGTKKAALHVANNDADEAVFDIILSGPANARLRPVVTVVKASARTGGAVPGAGADGLPAGTQHGTFGPPAINDVRKMAARAVMSAGGVAIPGIYLEDDAGVGRLAAFQGGTVPGAAGATYKSFLDPVLAPDGSVAFVAKLKGVEKNTDLGVWTDAFGHGLELVLREGSPVPGLPATATLKGISSLSLRNGELLVLLTLNTRESNDSVLLRMTGPGAGTVLLREGRTLAAGASTKVQTFSVLSPALGSPGHGRWHAQGLVVAKVSLRDGNTLLVKIAPDAAVTPLLSTADAATAIGTEARWKNFGLPAVDTTGAEFAVAATLKPARGGVLAADKNVLLASSDGTKWSKFARQNDPAPLDPEGPRYASFFDPVVNDAGEVAFRALLKGEGIGDGNQSAIFGGLPEDPQLIARLGDAVPDEAGAKTSAVWSKFISFALPGGPGAGMVLLAETSTAEIGVWAEDSTGTLRRLLRTGGVIETGGKPIAALTLLNPTPGAYGVTRSFTATGSIALVATFTDTTQALVRVDLP